MPFDFNIGDLESSYIVSLLFGVIAVVYAILKFIRDSKQEKQDKADYEVLEQFKKDLCNDMHDTNHRIDDIHHRIDLNSKRLNNIAERVSRLEGINESRGSPMKGYYNHDRFFKEPLNKDEDE